MHRKIRDYAFPLQSDIDATKSLDAKGFDNFVNRCMVAATNALKNDFDGYSKWERDHLISIFEGMRFTHKSIRILLKEKQNPTSIDALPLARVQLECLYAICLMLEDAQWIEVYAKDEWKKIYKQHLLEKEEWKSLPRCATSLAAMQPQIQRFTQFSRVTEAEQRTVEKEELDIPLPSGVQEVPIKRFPTPAGIINEVSISDRKQMLIRLYADYERLSSYVHGLAGGHDLRGILGKYENQFPSSGKENVFQKEIAMPSLYLSCLSVVQSASEVSGFYPNDLDLRAAVTEGWNLLSEHSLWGKVIWEIRTKKLLGSVS